MSTEILVCVLCRPVGASRDGRRAGQNLFDAVQDAAFDDAALTVRPIECLNACSRSCSVVLQSAGKTTYLFGGLVAEDDCAQDVVACARLHEASPDGMVARDTRPGLLREGVLARIPAPKV